MVGATTEPHLQALRSTVWDLWEVKADLLYGVMERAEKLV